MGTIILGSGISGISAGYHLKKAGEDAVIFEKNNDWGGLCGNFTIGGFRFDKFVHFSFAPDDYTRNIFEQSSPMYAHPSISYNYYNGFWLKHPAQNNLAPLPADEKVEIIKGFVNRKNKDFSEIENYEEWLRVQYGDYFAEHFPFKYTRKYWGVEPSELETKWVGNRMHSPDLDEVLRGAFEVQDKNFYYTNYMRYPKRGGFRSILNDCRKGLDIRFNREVVKIDTQNKQIIFKDGDKYTYTRLISSLPLPEIVNMLDNVPAEVKQAGADLKFTSGYMVSLGFNKPDIAKHLWFYIYDEDILASRVYSPSLKSPDNVPGGCSSLQAEIFFANSMAQQSSVANFLTHCEHNCLPKENMTPPRNQRFRPSHKGRVMQPAYSKHISPAPCGRGLGGGVMSMHPDEILENTISNLISMGLFKKEDILIKDIRFEKYANVIFDQDIYKNRQTVLDYLKTQGIQSIGRFGRWEYLWTHQAFASGKVEKV